MNNQYVSYFTDVFNKNLEKLTKRNLGLKNRIEEKIKEMLIDPLRDARYLEGLGKGKFRARVGDYRLVFMTCQKCREKGYEPFNQCLDCKSKSNNSIVYFDVQHRKHAYD